MVAEYSTLPNPTPQVSYLTTDHLGSPRINTDANGNTIARHDFQPFGEEIARPSYGADDVRRRFTSYERDSETDLDFAQARMYQNQHGRFTSVDPILSSVDPTIPQSWNRYIYCLNNPLFFVDPSGLIWVYRDSEDGKTRTFRWYDEEDDIPEGEGWRNYTESIYYIGEDEGLWLGAFGKHRRISKEDAALGQFDEFLRGPDSPLSKEEKDKLQTAFLKRMLNEHWEGKLIAELAGGSLGALSEAGVRGLVNVFLRSGARKAETALLSGMLREAVKGKGDFGIGSTTVDQAEALGRAWVGEGAAWSSSGKALVSADGLRQFRPSSFKPGNTGKPFGKVQANLEWRLKDSGEWQGNAHIDIIP